MCGSKKQTTNSTSTYTPNAQAMGAFTDALDQGQQLANTPFNYGTTQNVAGFNPQQTQAFDQVSQMQGMYAPYIDAASGYTAAGAAPITGAQIQNYQNPFQQQVIDAAMANVNHQNNVQQRDLIGNVAGANGLGNNRAGIMQAELARGQGANSDQMIANLLSGGFNTALGAAQGDASRQMAAGNQFANYGNMAQNLSLQGSQALLGSGNQQQQQLQSMYDAASGNQQSATMWPYQNAQYQAMLAAGLGPLMGGTTTGNSTTKQTSSNPLGTALAVAGMLADGGRVGYAAGGGIDMGGFTFPNMTLQAARPVVPQLPGSPNMGNDGEASDKKSFDLGKNARKGIDNVLNGLTGGAGDVSGGGGGGDGLLSSLGSFFGFADGGTLPAAPRLSGSSYVPSVGSVPGAAPASYFAPGLAALTASRSAPVAAAPQTPTLPPSTGGQHSRGFGIISDILHGLSGAMQQGDSGNPIGSISDWMTQYAPQQHARGGNVRRYDDGGYVDSDTYADPFEGSWSADSQGLGSLGAFPGELSSGTFSTPSTKKSDSLVAETSPDLLFGDVPSGLAKPFEGRAFPQPGASPQPKAQPDPSTYASISSQLETGAKDPLSGVSSIAPDTNGSRSYGNFGLNSLKGNSAWQFRNEYGDQFGITADPGTADFDRQWKAAARNDPTALHAAETDWYNNNVLTGVRGKLEGAGVNSQIAADPRVQAYFADRSVQQGTGSIEKHADRIQAVLDNSGGDPVKFLRSMSDLDKTSQALRSDFPSALKSGVYSEKGNNNRVEGRLRLALGLGEEPTTLSGISAPDSFQGPAAGSAPIRSLVQKGKDPDQPQATKTYADATDKHAGGLLKRLLGIDFNPLNLDQHERMALLTAGLGMMSSGNTGAGGLMGLEYLQNARNSDRNASLAAQKLAMEFEKERMPKLSKYGTDAAGNDMMGWADPYRQTVTPLNTAGTQNGQPSATTEAMQNGVTGPDFLSVLQKESPEAANLVKKMGNYEIPLPTARNPKTMKLISMTEQAFPGWNAQDYKAQQNLRTSFTAGKDADEVKSLNTAIGHTMAAYDSIDTLGNTKSSLVNTPINAIKGQVSADFQKARSRMMTEMDTAVNEFNRATTGKPITVDEHKEMRTRLSQNSSPEDLKETMRSFAELMDSRLKASAEKWNAGLKLSPDDPRYKTAESLLNKDSLAKFNKLMGRDSGELSAQKRGSSLGDVPRPTGLSDSDLLRAAQKKIQDKPDLAPKVQKQLEEWGVRF